MAIKVDKKQKIFSISTPNTTYMMGVLQGGHLLHLYYGKRLEDMNGRYLLRHSETEDALYWRKKDEEFFFHTAAFEYPVWGTGDFRDVCLCVRDENGCRGCRLQYDSYRIIGGKPSLPGLPATFGDNAETLEITMKDEIIGLTAVLRYSVFADSDALMKSVVLKNEGDGKLYLERALSSSLSLDNEGYELSTLHGSWGRERHIITRPVTEGKHIVALVCGKTSHWQQPFMMLTSPGATQNWGHVYGINLVYSGNFIAETELNFRDDIRMTMGIHPDGFDWVLAPGDTFQTPEAVHVFSADGIGEMTHTFHDLYRKHLIRSPWLHRKRPILINNWEATYFDFNEEKLVSIAAEAAKLGIEMLVMDDGWFGRRNDDNSSLGDWMVNEEKLKGGLNPLVERINQLGLKFGIWIEPEMVSPDSDLYRAHPDWAIRLPGRTATLCRNQYVLDMTRSDVREYPSPCWRTMIIWNCMKRTEKISWS